MLRGNFDVLDWGYKQLPVPIACRQMDTISCGLFTCMNIKEIVHDRDILLVGGRKKKVKSIRRRQLCGAFISSTL
jgi:hypothetical protein